MVVALQQVTLDLRCHAGRLLHKTQAGTDVKRGPARLGARLLDHGLHELVLACLQHLYGLEHNAAPLNGCGLAPRRKGSLSRLDGSTGVGCGSGWGVVDDILCDGVEHGERVDARVDGFAVDDQTKRGQFCTAQRHCVREEGGRC